MFQKVQHKDRFRDSAIHANSIFRQEILKEQGKLLELPRFYGMKEELENTG